MTMRSSRASFGYTSICTSAYGYTPMLNTFPCPANQVSVQPPLSQMRIGHTLLITRTGVASGFVSLTDRPF